MFTSLLAVGLARSLVFEPTLLRATDPLPLALSFVGLAALSLFVALRLWRDGP